MHMNARKERHCMGNMTNSYSSTRPKHIRTMATTLSSHDRMGKALQDSGLQRSWQ